MEHKYWEERLQGFIDDELGPADRLAVQAHLDECTDCEANLKYFQSLKKRIQAHAETIEIPSTVEKRLQTIFARKRNPFRQPRYIVPSLAIAAILIIGLLIPIVIRSPYLFEDQVLIGRAICYGCSVADRAGLERGDLCGDGHRLGLETKDGMLWQVASDLGSLEYLKNLSLIDKEVQIYGQVLVEERLIRIKRLDILTEQAKATSLSNHRTVSR